MIFNSFLFIRAITTGSSLDIAKDSDNKPFHDMEKLDSRLPITEKHKESAFDQLGGKEMIMSSSFEPPVSSLMKKKTDSTVKDIIDRIKEGHNTLEAMIKKVTSLDKDYEKLIEILSKDKNEPEDRLDLKIIEVQENPKRIPKNKK